MAVNTRNSKKNKEKAEKISVKRQSIEESGKKVLKIKSKLLELKEKMKHASAKERASLGKKMQSLQKELQSVAYKVENADKEVEQEKSSDFTGKSEVSFDSVNSSAVQETMAISEETRIDADTVHTETQKAEIEKQVNDAALAKHDENMTDKAGVILGAAISNVIVEKQEKIAEEKQAKTEEQAKIKEEAKIKIAPVVNPVINVVTPVSNNEKIPDKVEVIELAVIKPPRVIKVNGDLKNAKTIKLTPEQMAKIRQRRAERLKEQQEKDKKEPVENPFSKPVTKEFAELKDLVEKAPNAPINPEYVKQVEAKEVEAKIAKINEIMKEPVTNIQGIRRNYGKSGDINKPIKITFSKEVQEKIDASRKKMENSETKTENPNNQEVIETKSESSNKEVPVVEEKKSFLISDAEMKAKIALVETAIANDLNKSKQIPKIVLNIPNNDRNSR